MKRIFLHIGLEKTGTTSIQRFLQKNRDALRAKDYLYPRNLAPGGGGSQHAVVAYAQNDDKIDDTRMHWEATDPQSIKRFRNRLDNNFIPRLVEAKCNNIIISSEHLSSRLKTREELERLRELLGPIASDIHVYVYLRRQDDFFLSSYSTYVKSGDSRRFDQVAQPQSETSRYDYLMLLDLWADVFGEDKIFANLFDRRYLHDGDVVSDFLTKIGITDMDSYIFPPRANEMLDYYTLEFLRLMNPSVPAVIDGKLTDLRGGLGKLLEAFADKPKPALPQRFAEEIMNFFRDSNDEVARKYFPDLDERLFGDTPNRDGHVVLGDKPLELDRAIEISGYLWREQKRLIRKGPVKK